MIDLVIITYPRWSDLRQDSGSFDAIFNQRSSTTQKLFDNTQTINLKKECFSSRFVWLKFISCKNFLY